ncbi:MAG: methylenetetrahydrofolate reductase [Bacteroidales bacterium]|nr:MAG: methylenetetrahydrofolate reductase [Bacteroidales bacterium]
MKEENILQEKIKAGDFIITAEYLPEASTNISIPDSLKKCGVSVINVADNPYGPVTSALAVSALLCREGMEPVFQIVTRDRNRIALQSDILGAASLGIKNILCLSGYHQSLSVLPESASVYDIDSIQLIDIITRMNNKGTLVNGSAIKGDFSMLVGAVANPFLRPLDLNILRTIKKVEAGAKFIQTQAVYDTTIFQEWLNALNKEGITEKAAILAGILPLTSYAEAVELSEKHTDFYIPESQMKKIQDAGDEDAQKKEGLKLSVDTINKIKGMKGLKGLHIISGGKEDIISVLISEAGLLKQ